MQQHRPRVRELRGKIDAVPACRAPGAVQERRRTGVRVTALEPQGDADKPGPVVALLLTAGMSSASSSLTLRNRDRQDLLEDRLFMNLYTRSWPIGVGRIVLDASVPRNRH
jgi:hypothetical protein